AARVADLAGDATRQGWDEGALHERHHVEQGLVLAQGYLVVLGAPFSPAAPKRHRQLGSWTGHRLLGPLSSAIARSPTAAASLASAARRQKLTADPPAGRFHTAAKPANIVAPAGLSQRQQRGSR